MPDATVNAILVVDDNAAKRYTIVRVLQHAGFTVNEAATGAEALRHIMGPEKPALVVLDIQLPDISGFEVCRRIKADPTTHPIPVLQISAHFISSENRTQGLEGGADAYLAVPVEPPVLVATARALLRLRAAEEQARAASLGWQTTFDAINDAVCLLDRNGIVTRCNRAMAALLDRSPESIVGLSRAVLAEQVCSGADALALPKEPPPGRQTQEGLCDGRWLRVTTDPLPDEDGGAVWILSDISEQKRAEAALAAVLERKSHIAETLQSSMLTAVPEDAFPPLAIRTFYAAALREAGVGGDFFDTFALADGRVALTVGDVSGKGLRAASRTAEVKYALRAFLWEEPDPARALTRLNRFLHVPSRSGDGDSEGFVVLSLIVVNPASGEAVFCVAGAEPPLVFPPSPSGAGQSMEVGGLPLGVEREETYRGVSRLLAPGDTLLLATDGITEARRGDEFLGYAGMARLAQAVFAGGRPLGEAGQAILDGARDFAAGTLQDDACLLLARWQPAANDTNKEMERGTC